MNKIVLKVFGSRQSFTVKKKKNPSGSALRGSDAARAYWAMSTPRPREVSPYPQWRRQTRKLRSSGISSPQERVNPKLAAQRFPTVRRDGSTPNSLHFSAAHCCTTLSNCQSGQKILSHASMTILQNHSYAFLELRFLSYSLPYNSFLSEGLPYKKNDISYFFNILGNFCAKNTQNPTFML